MLGMNIAPGIILGLAIFSIAVTLITNWLAAGRRRPTLPRSVSLGLMGPLLANILWLLLVFAAGMIATRYIERIDNTILGYMVFGLLAFLLSFARALVHRRSQQSAGAKPPVDSKALVRAAIHYGAYFLLATVLYLTISWLLRRHVELILLIPLWFGALLPYLDSQRSPLGRLLPFISNRIEARFGHGQGWHSLTANALVALFTAPLILVDLEAWSLISLGFFSHLVLDLLTPEGSMLFWPITHTRYSVFGGFVGSPGSTAECWLVASLAIVAAVLLVIVDIGPLPPRPAPSLSYEQTLERYYGMRGRNLVFAYIEGSWQATGRPVRGRFEILNAAGESYTLLDRYDGKVFTAGRGTEDNLYLNRIILQPGSAAVIKPAEIHLQDQPLADGLPVLYEMQQEPGLQHIYVSGDVVVPALPSLQTDYAQTGLRRIQTGDKAGHYTFHYLTASDLIELSNLPVETAALVIIATYASPASGPTVTPLPAPLPTPEPAP